MSKPDSNSDRDRLLVNDVQKKLPPLRADIEMIPVTQDEKELIYFHDPQGYIVKPFVLDKQIAMLLPMLNGQFSIRDIGEELKRHGNEVEEQQLLEFFRQLDSARLLLSPWFRHYKTEVEELFEKADVRPAACAGLSYPHDENELRNMLDSAFSTNGADAGGEGRIKALYAPHIDPRIGLDAYVGAFRPLSGLKPSRVVILATSHYAGMYHPVYDGKPFIITRKSFETPLGMVSVDQKTVDLLESKAGDIGCSLQDRAHRNEHSIELHLLFLQYIWSHSFEVVPLLVGSLEEMYYKKDGDIGKKVDAMASLLRDEFDKDDDTLFLISGDLAHVGKKFGDREPASSFFKEVKTFDRTFMEHAAEAQEKKLLTLIGEDYDRYRICGFPPLFTALSALSDVSGTVTGYELWDEREQESAVTYGSLLYRQAPEAPR